MRGFVVEETIKGCSCQPLTILPWNHHGEDWWHDLTDLQKDFTVSGFSENEGICPLCNEPVFYNEYLVTLDNDNGMWHTKQMERAISFDTNYTTQKGSE